MPRLFWFLLSAGVLALAGCPDPEEGEDDPPIEEEEDTCAGEAQEITFVTPEAGAEVPVTPCSLTLTEGCLEVRASFCRKVADRDLIEVVLEKDGDVLPGSVRYRERDLEVVFRPFAILESRGTYTVTVRADGVEESMEFTAQAANEGALPAIEGSTFAFSIEEFLWPEQLTSLFNNLRTSIPDNLINVNDVTPDADSSPDDESATVNMVGAAAELGSEPPALLVEDPEGGVFTSTGLRLEGRLRGSWFIIGPAPVSLVASGVPFVVHDFVASGVFSEDGQHIEHGYLTGLLNIEELGNAVGQDLSSICTSPATAEVCDEEGNARLAGRIAADTVDIGFDCFVTSPINKSVDNAPDASVEVYCSEPLGQDTLLSLVTCDASDDAPYRAEEEGPAATWSCYLEEGEPVEGAGALDGKQATFTPDSSLTPGVWYRFGIEAMSETGEITDRHAVFRVAP